jgi:ribonucleoside-diphosphate reductase alpha chain
MGVFSNVLTYQCNLTEINVSDVEDQSDLNERAKAASFLGTLQAGYTDFHYLRPEWADITEKEALIGVGQTGIGSGTVLRLDLTEAAEVVVTENSRVAALIGINEAARTTTIKPSGTSSLVVGSSSGVHAWHNDFYIRRMRVGKNEAMYEYMITNFPELIEDCAFKPHLEAVMSFPQRAPVGAILRTENPIDTLERVAEFNEEWVQPGHRYGKNFHNVSCTISVKEDEWVPVGQWMWRNRSIYTGISVLPYDGGSYVQAPFEDCTEEEFNRLSKFLHNIDLSQVLEVEDHTNLNDQVACGADGCAV